MPQRETPALSCPQQLADAQQKMSWSEPFRGSLTKETTSGMMFIGFPYKGNHQLDDVCRGWFISVHLGIIPFIIPCISRADGKFDFQAHSPQRRTAARGRFAPPPASSPDRFGGAGQMGSRRHFCRYVRKENASTIRELEPWYFTQLYCFVDAANMNRCKRSITSRTPKPS